MPGREGLQSVDTGQWSGQKSMSASLTGILGTGPSGIVMSFGTPLGVRKSPKDESRGPVFGMGI